ncbi:uncharacterized protein C8A04DRAFT_35566 [Dichotomopilus funicola]|uniref:Uncharacterized protein n=1 Tax=Dichotomopilus funicola TaxID=1934379 RepID=A0AAN6V6K5_9PEZI|nr:hypothetical protein C8A04DRAFT_35566 [Dichotomopilus funicola]
MSTTPNTQLTPSTPLTNLIRLYKDITLLSQIASPTLVLHPADRALVSPPRAPLVGIEAAQQHEESLVKAAAARGGKLVFRPESIQVDGRGVFGVVLGVLEGRLIGSDDNKGPGEETSERCCEGKGRKEGEIEMAFCGVWRFDGTGRAVEHWENAADPAALGRWLQGK